MRDNLLAPTFQRPPRRSAMPIVIDDGITQYSIKPRYGALLIAHLCASFQSPYKRRLQNIFRSGPGFHPRLQKSQKLPVTIH